jgi:hypothetical protein
MSTTRIFPLAILVLAIAACSDSDGTGSDGAVVPGGGGGSGPGGTGGNSPIAGAGGGSPGSGGAGGSTSACMPTLANPTDEGGPHVALCAPVTFGSNPPSSGNHYQVWPVFREYDKPVPWGFLVHGLEHGAVVIVYNCPTGCAQEIADAKAMIATLPAKTGCTRPAVILTPDPTLTTRWAAAAWGHTLRATCFDKDAFAQFANQYMNMGPERISGDCGYVDLEAMGWCPAAAP